MMANLYSNNTEEVVNNTQREDPPSQDLANILKKSILESYQQFCAIRETLIAENVAVTPTSEPPKKGKRVKNPTVAEQDVSFSLPKDCDLTSFKNTEEVQSKLEGWKIQSTQRPTRTFDTGQRVKKAKKVKKTHTTQEQKENPEPNSASNEKVEDVEQTEEKKENVESNNGSEAIIDLVSEQPYSCYHRLEDISDDFSIYDDLIDSYFS
ncbi:unnamed protein product [Lupinus luteus]|uniref:Uncharacterized protein n=1 Tax=Lupinus luteus TaxID=3873 RepID=A0AAV1W9K7_LUPLU